MFPGCRFIAPQPGTAKATRRFRHIDKTKPAWRPHMRYAERIAAATALLTFAATAPFSWAQTTNDGEGYAQRLRELLNNQGYSQIVFLDLNGDTYSANACSDDRTYRLTFNRNARIIEKSETGDCAPPTPDQQVSEDVIIDALYGQASIFCKEDLPELRNRNLLPTDINHRPYDITNHMLEEPLPLKMNR
jgi:hypothetical protein